jgi:hypothetical protein
VRPKNDLDVRGKERKEASQCNFPHKSRKTVVDMCIKVNCDWFMFTNVTSERNFQRRTTSIHPSQPSYYTYQTHNSCIFEKWYSSSFCWRWKLWLTSASLTKAVRGDGGSSSTSSSAVIIWLMFEDAQLQSRKSFYCGPRLHKVSPRMTSSPR